MGILESKIIKIIIHQFLVRILKVRITNEKDWLLRINLEIKKKKKSNWIALEVWAWPTCKKYFRRKFIKNIEAKNYCKISRRYSWKRI